MGMKKKTYKIYMRRKMLEEQDYTNRILYNKNRLLLLEIQLKQKQYKKNYGE